MRRLLTALALLLAPMAWAQATTSCPMATGTLGQNMENRVMLPALLAKHKPSYSRTDDTIDGLEISLEHVLLPSWTCATWSVELLVPPDALVVGDSLKTGLTRTDTAEFEIEIVDWHDESGAAHHHDMSHVDRMEFDVVFVVTVYNGGDNAMFADGVSDAQGRFHFRTRIVADDYN